jgi:HSP20 family protein
MFELMRTITRQGNGGATDPVLRAWADLALPVPEGRAPHALAADVVETEDAIVVRLDLPGHKADDIQLKVENDVLTIEAELKLREGEGKGETFHRSERVFGKAFRSFALPAGVDTARTAASYVDGVLEITLPKREEAKPRTIQVKATR